MFNFTEQIMPVRIFGLFGLHHGLEIELKSKVKESIQEEAFFDYNNRSYEIQSYSLTGSRRYINVRQIPTRAYIHRKKNWKFCLRQVDLQIYWQSLLSSSNIAL
ncbi:MAG: hypothetical protein CM1200mP30_26870 [Pseudomonadota bacterium]|nr:MAG: hypothetical protein CM1200mP30_26870 [Pseudomonadota bacterium]